MFRFIPAFFRANTLFRAGGEFVDDVFEAKIGVNLLQQGRKRNHFALDLLFGTENVPIVLRKRAHPHDAVQTARRLVAVARAKLAEAQRQVAVAFQAMFVDQDMTRAVHRLQGVIALF